MYSFWAECIKSPDSKGNSRDPQNSRSFAAYFAGRMRMFKGWLLTLVMQVPFVPAFSGCELIYNPHKMKTTIHRTVLLLFALCLTLGAGAAPAAPQNQEQARNAA